MKSRVGRIRFTTWSTPGFCRPMAFNRPPVVSYIRCGGFPRRGSNVVPLRHRAPASRFEKPLTRVYSSPKPTHPDNSTRGVSKRNPQKSIASRGSWALVMWATCHAGARPGMNHRPRLRTNSENKKRRITRRLPFPMHRRTRPLDGSGERGLKPGLPLSGNRRLSS